MWEKEKRYQISKLQRNMFIAVGAYSTSTNRCIMEMLDASRCFQTSRTKFTRRCTKDAGVTASPGIPVAALGRKKRVSIKLRCQLLFAARAASLTFFNSSTKTFDQRQLHLACFITSRYVLQDVANFFLPSHFHMMKRLVRVSEQLKTLSKEDNHKHSVHL